MKQRITAVFFCVSILFISCDRKYVSYKITNGYKKWSTQIAKNYTSFENIKNSGSGLYAEFNDIYSTVRQPISYHIFSSQDFSEIKLEAMVFVLGDKQTDISLNKKFTVTTKVAEFIVEDFPELHLTGYKYVLWRDESKIRIDMRKVFAGCNLSPRNEYDMKLIVKYRLDSKPYTQEINYKVVPYEADMDSEWIYTLFPDAGI